MQILPLMSHTQNVSFGRKPSTTDEVEMFRSTSKDALKYIGNEELSMIVHGSMFPQSGRDTLVGSPLSKGAKEFEDFLSLFGFSTTQHSPDGKISKFKVSPYDSSTFSRNELLVDLELLTNEKYSKLLSNEDYFKFTVDASKQSFPAMADFEKGLDNVNGALRVAFEKFQKLDAKNPFLAAFNSFSKNNYEKIQKEVIFNILANENKTNEFVHWKDPLDAKLIELKEAKDPQAIKRFKNLLKTHKNEIEYEKFVQFIIEQQMKNNDYGLAFQQNGDALVGFSRADKWANPSAFLKSWAMGCKSGSANKDFQQWDFPVVNPDKLFTKDGKLDVAGKIIRDKLEHILNVRDSVRIDHILGLIDPYIYPVEFVDENGKIIGSTKLYNGDHILRLENRVSNARKYKDILDKIVLPLLDEKKIPYDKVVWENLAHWTEEGQDFYYNQKKLPQIIVTQDGRGEGYFGKKGFLGYIGSHDSEPYLKKVTELRATDFDIPYYAGILNADPKDDAIRAQSKDLLHNAVNMFEAKAEEVLLFFKRSQFFVSDFFGFKNIYNSHGDDKPSDWRLRIPNNYQDEFYKALSNPERQKLMPSADVAKAPFCPLNFPKMFKKLIKATDDWTIAKAPENQRDALRAELAAKRKPIEERLEKMISILQEPEQAARKAVDAVVDNTEQIIGTVTEKTKEVTKAAPEKAAEVSKKGFFNMIKQHKVAAGLTLTAFAATITGYQLLKGKNEESPVEENVSNTVENAPVVNTSASVSNSSSVQTNDIYSSLQNPFKKAA